MNTKSRIEQLREVGFRGLAVFDEIIQKLKTDTFFSLSFDPKQQIGWLLDDIREALAAEENELNKVAEAAQYSGYQYEIDEAEGDHE